MAIQVEFGEELALTYRALEFFVACMYLHVFIQIGPLRETEPTIRDLAHVRPLFCVDPQVVKEVVPLPEHLAASLISAREQSNDPSRVLHPMLENQIVFCVGLVLEDSYLRQFKLRVVLNHNLFIILYKLVVL